MNVLNQDVVSRVQSLQKIRQAVEQEGARAVFFTGKMEIWNPAKKQFQAAEGLRRVEESGDVTYFIKVDGISRNAEQIYSHEYFHGLIHENRALLLDLAEELEQKIGRAGVEKMVAQYVVAYKGIYGTYTEGMTQDQATELEMKYIEEILADAYAKIRRSRTNISEASHVVENRRGTIDAAKENRRAMRDTRGAPEQKYSIAKELKNELSNVYNNTFDSESGEVKIGETSDFLVKEIGAKPLPNYMPANKAYSAMATEEKAKRDGKPIGDAYNYHGLGVDGLYELLERAEAPVATYADEPSETDGRFDRIVLVTDKEINRGIGVVVVEVDSVARDNNVQIKANKTITAYDKQAIISAVQKAFDDGRLLYIDKKGGQTYNSGRKDANCPTTMSDVTRKSNIQRFWENVKWAKYVKNSGSKIFTSGNQKNNTMADALKKAGISVDSKSNEQSKQEPEVKQKFSVEDEAAELDEEFRRKMGEDLEQRETAEGDVQNTETDYEALSIERMEQRARDASLSQLRQMKKSAESRLSRYHWAKRNNILTPELIPNPPTPCGVGQSQL